MNYRYIKTTADLKQIVRDNNENYLMPLTSDEIDEVVEAIDALPGRPEYGEDWTEFLESLNDLGTYSPSYMDPDRE